MAKISGFIIGIALVSLIFGIWILNLSEFTGVYSQNTEEFNSSNFAAYNKLEELRNDTQNYRDSTKISGQDLTFKDVVGGYFASGYNALKTTTTSVDTFNSVYQQGINDANLGQTGQLFNSYIFIALLITIFIGVLISAILKAQV